MKLRLRRCSVVVALVVTLALSGCFKISFQNGPQQPSQSFKQGEWHHDGVLGLVEFSDPVDLHERCDGRAWNTIKTHKTFVQGLVGGLTYSLYTPWDVAYSCR